LDSALLASDQPTGEIIATAPMTTVNINIAAPSNSPNASPPDSEFVKAAREEKISGAPFPNAANVTPDPSKRQKPAHFHSDGILFCLFSPATLSDIPASL